MSQTQTPITQIFIDRLRHNLITEIHEAASVVGILDESHVLPAFDRAALLALMSVMDGVSASSLPPASASPQAETAASLRAKKAWATKKRNARRKQRAADGSDAGEDAGAGDGAEAKQ